MLGLCKRIALVVTVLVMQLTVSGVALSDQVSVRTQKSSGYSRISFRWPQPVGHIAKRQGNQLTVEFARPIQANLQAVVRGLNEVVGVDPAPNNRTIVLRIKGDFSVRSYDSGATVIVDVVRGATAKTPQTSNAGPSSTGPNVAVRTGVHPTYSRIVFDWKKKPGYSLSRVGDATTLKFDKAANVNLRKFSKGGIRNIKNATAATSGGKLAVTFTIAANSQVKAFISGTKVVMDVFAPKGSAPKSPKVAAPTSKAAPVAKVENAPTALTPKAPAPATPSTATPPQPTVQKPLKNTAVKTQMSADGVVTLRFDWDEPVGAAVFRRSEALWVVFDKSAKMDTKALAKGGKGLVTSVEQVASNTGTVLRMTTPEGINPSIKRSGLSWVLEFSPQPLLPGAPLKADAQPDSPLGARLFISVPEPGNVIAFQDPEIGDNLLVVPVIPLGHGLSRQWKYPQLHLLASKQGVVVKPVSDDVRVRPLRQGVEITSSGTLQVSAVTPEERASIDLEAARNAGGGSKASGPLSRVMDLEKWNRKDLQNFMDTRQGLFHTVTKAKGPRAREQARNDLMNFYFANGFEAEALGVLETIRADRPEIENEPRFRLMRGAANWLMERYADARKDLYHESLNGNDEGTFWRALVVAGEGNVGDAAYDLRKVGAIASPYPKALKVPTTLVIADAAVELGDVKQATQYLEVLSVNAPTAAQQNQIDFVSGKLKALSGDPDGAIADWETVMEGVHRPSRAKAAVARTELLLKLELFTPKDAIEEYEKLRFVWRGDEFEFALLKRLGGLYLEETLYREGLTALKQAVTQFPEHPESDQLTKRMSDAFLFLYMERGADVLPPVTAIALYDEFRELTPAGAAGDVMIRRLADRLVDIDLLDRAAALLDAQVDFRLKGEEKATVGARLAFIHLLDLQYDKALESIVKSKGRNLSEAIVAERILLEAQANIGLEQPEKALELLLTETSLKAEYMRAGIYWREKNWNEASKAMAKVVRGLESKARSPLDDKQALAVMSLSIAYTLSTNEAALSLVKANYGAAMQDTNFADAFRLISDPPEAGMLNYRSLDTLVQRVASFQVFMDDYRQRVTDGQLSSLY